MGYHVKIMAWSHCKSRCSHFVAMSMRSSTVDVYFAAPAVKPKKIKIILSQIAEIETDLYTKLLMGENVKSLKKENDRLREQIKSLSKDFENLKDKMAAEVSKATSTTTCEPPNELDV